MSVAEIVPSAAIATFVPAVKAATTFAVSVTFADVSIPSSLLLSVAIITPAAEVVAAAIVALLPVELVITMLVEAVVLARFVAPDALTTPEPSIDSPEPILTPPKVFAAAVGSVNGADPAIVPSFPIVMLEPALSAATTFAVSVTSALASTEFNLV